ncbi:hypothetical protein Tsp_04353 [Trichinella spiralis]|uniref:hypothetical protein n=1 Tax=Trichinella spiralis TaxID=6334 RepID=UPI0001EFC511|nr:hypothetical protein Tsp_04353 [Trichinella spiralis]
MPLFRLLTVGTITCNGIIPAYDRSFSNFPLSNNTIPLWSQVLLVTECLVLSYVLCWFLRPCVNKAFDLYPVHLPKRLPVYVDVTTSIDDGIMLELSKKSNQSKVPHNANSQQNGCRLMPALGSMYFCGQLMVSDQHYSLVGIL